MNTLPIDIIKLIQKYKNEIDQIRIQNTKVKVAHYKNEMLKQLEWRKFYNKANLSYCCDCGEYKTCEGWGGCRYKPCVKKSSYYYCEDWNSESEGDFSSS